MSKDMLGISLGEFLRPMIDFFTKLLSEDGGIWWSQFKKFLRKEQCWVSEQVAQASLAMSSSRLLELISTVVVPATTSNLVAKEKFVVNTAHNAPVKISFLSDSFTGWFLSGESIIEGPIEEAILQCARLRKVLHDSDIINELGGTAKSETTVSQMFSLIEVQRNGESGILLNNGNVNIFYIKDKNGLLTTVCVGMRAGGWCVVASPIGSSPRSLGSRVFYPHPVLESPELRLRQQV